MSSRLNQPKIYHITHLNNLASILADHFLYSDAVLANRNTSPMIVGMDTIKHRRLTQLSVKCFPDTKVGEYVPFYFCPRSVMLFMIYRANDPRLTYRGGQTPILHLQADLQRSLRGLKRRALDGRSH